MIREPASAPGGPTPAQEGARPLLAWASDHFAFPLPDSHPFPLAKYARVRERLLAERPEIRRAQALMRQRPSFAATQPKMG